jgi:hypothetical protein
VELRGTPTLLSLDLSKSNCVIVAHAEEMRNLQTCDAFGNLYRLTKKIITVSVISVLVEPHATIVVVNGNWTRGEKW